MVLHYKLRKEQNVKERKYNENKNYNTNNN